MSEDNYLESLPKCTECGDLSDKEGELCFCCRNPLSYAAIERKKNQLQQELDAARAEIHSIKVNWNKWNYQEIEQELTDAKAQIADYEAALEKIKNDTVQIKTLNEANAYCKYIAEETLNKWSKK